MASLLLFGGALVLRPAQAAAFSLRINTGAGQVVDSTGRTWLSDRSYMAGGGINGSGRAIAGTNDDVVYQSNRWGMPGYNLAVPKTGNYRLRLHYAETVFTTPGARVFDVLAEGKLIANDVDIVASVGAETALVQTFNLSLKDKTLNLRFTAVIDDPMVSGIELDAVETLGTPGPSTTTTVLGTTTTTQPTTTTTAPPVTTTTTAPPVTTTTTAPPVTTTTTTPPPPPPTATGFPGPGNTGVPAGVTLRSSGSITTSADGQVIDALDISGSVRVIHDNVTIKRFRIRHPGGQAITVDPNTHGLVVEDCEIDGTGNNTGDAVIGDSQYTIRRCNIHHFGEGPRANGNIVIQDNWIHDFLDFSGVGGHQDTIQSTGGDNIVIRHNNLEMNIDAGNAVLMVGTYIGSNLTVDNNLFAGGGWTAYGGTSPGWTNVRFTNNRFSTRYFQKCGYHGPLTNAENAVQFGNVWHDDFGSGDYSTARQYPNGNGPRTGQPI